MKKSVLVLGASDNTSRFSNMAVKKLTAYGYHVVAVGSRAIPENEVPIQTSIPDGIEVDTVTLYLNPERQRDYLEIILQLNPRRIIFNPGTENPVFASRAQQKGIQTVEDCTLVMLGSGTF